MDQDAFRKLLSTSSNNSNLNQKSNNNNNKSLALGSGKINKFTNKLNPSGSTYKPSSTSTSSTLKPRKFTSKETDGKSKEAARGGYRDRASERRQGLDGDFAEAEHLLKNFQARVAAAGSQIDKDTLEQQTKYLGGDERHTILVKGLDHALLDRRKAELSQGGKLGQVTDEDLETAYEQNVKQSSSIHPNNTLSSTASNSTNPTNKKHRDELLAQLKKSIHQQPQDLVVVEKLKAVGKFKPIGSTSLDLNPQELERKEHKRRKAEKKKKKKALKSELVAPSLSSNLDPSVQKTEISADPKIVETLPTDENLKSSERQPSQSEIKEQSDDQPKGTPLTPSASAAVINQPKQAAQIKQEIEDEDLDIFGDAGEYKGLDEESSEEEDGDQKINPSEPLAEDKSGSLHPQETKKRKTYFEDDELESDSNSEKVRKQEALEESLKKPSELSRRTNVTIEQPGQETLDDDTNNPDSSELPRLTKLEGLSGSADIKSILAVDAIHEKEEKRKAKKQKNKSEKNLTDKDKLNRDFLEMERFLNQNKNNKKSDSNSSPHFSTKNSTEP